MIWLKSGQLLRWLAVSALALLVLSGCLDDDSSSNNRSNTNFGEVQFYNALAGSPKVKLVATVVEGATTPTTTGFSVLARYAAGSARVRLTPNNYELELFGLNPDTGAYDSPLWQGDLTVERANHQLLVLRGSYDAPELERFTYTTDASLASANAFRARAYNFTSDFAQLELLYGEVDAGLEAATLHATLGQGQESAFETLPEGRYAFYVVDADTGDLLLSTGSIPFAEGTSYFLVLRDNPMGDGVVLDQVSGNANYFSYGETLPSASVRVYQSIDDLGAVDFVFEGDSADVTLASVMPDEFLAPTDIAEGDYRLNVTDAGNSSTLHLEDVAYTAWPGVRTNILIVRNADDEVAYRDYSETLTTSAYESEVNLGVLARVVNEDDTVLPLNAYLVSEARHDAATADPEGDVKAVALKLTSLSLGSVARMNLVPGNYYVYIAYPLTVDNGDGTTRTEEVNLVDGQLITLAPNTNYQLMFEPDAGTASGYRLTLY